MAEEEDAAKRAATEMVVSAEYIPRRKALVAALTTELKELVAECRRLMRSSSRNYQCLWLDDAGRWRVRDAEEMVPQDIPEPWIHLSIQMRKVWDISQWMKKVAETSEAWIIRVTTLNAIMHHSLPPQQITALFSTIYNFPFVWSDVAHFWRTAHQGNIPAAITDLFQGKDEDRHPPQHQHQPRHTSSEELPNAADGVGGDGEGEEEEEEDEAECGVCHGDKDYKHWICCDDCNVWYHLRCVGITLKESRRMDRLNLLYHCSHCSNPTSSSSAP